VDFAGTFVFGARTGSVSGTLQGDSISLKVVSDAVCPEGEGLTANGKVSADGTKMSGTTVVVDCRPPYSGTFTATKTKDLVL
jgi:hypothetical protein